MHRYKMSECRICFGIETDVLLRPCMCKGSIMFVHQNCLLQWLKSKYPATYQTLIRHPKSGSTGLKCELCKYEYKGRVSYLKATQIAKKIKNSNTTYLLLMNIPIMIYLAYKCNYLIRHIFYFFYHQAYRMKQKSLISNKAKRIVEFIVKVLLEIFSVSVFGAALPLIGLNTMKLCFKLLSEFKVIEFENFIY